MQLNDVFKESNLRKNFVIYYLNNVMGEIAVVRLKNGIARSINQKGKIIILKGNKVYPPELHIYTKIKRIQNESLDFLYNRALQKTIISENKLYKKLLPFKGKGKLFIRCEMIQDTDIKNTWLFTEVIHLVKGVWF